jgi:hypothetical protein
MAHNQPVKHRLFNFTDNICSLILNFGPIVIAGLREAGLSRTLTTVVTAENAQQSIRALWMAGEVTGSGWLPSKINTHRMIGVICEAAMRWYMDMRKAGKSRSSMVTFAIEPKRPPFLSSTYKIALSRTRR